MKRVIRFVGRVVVVAIVAVFSVSSFVSITRTSVDFWQYSYAILSAIVLLFGLFEVVQAVRELAPSLVAAHAYIISDRFIINTWHAKRRIRRFQKYLSSGLFADKSAKVIGDIALYWNLKDAVRALENAAVRTISPEEVINPCLYTIGRIVWEKEHPDQSLSRDCFRALGRLLKKGNKLASASAFTVGKILRKSTNMQIRRQIKIFILKGIDAKAELPRMEMVKLKRAYEKEHRISWETV
jgi:hypothetical protein